MSLYAIGDLHLHFASELKAPGQLHDPVWRDHEAVFRRHCEALIRPEDTLVLLGDHSWGRNQEESAPDLEWIAALPEGYIVTVKAVKFYVLIPCRIHHIVPGDIPAVRGTLSHTGGPLRSLPQACGIRGRARPRRINGIYLQRSQSVSQTACDRR